MFRPILAETWDLCARDHRIDLTQKVPGHDVIIAMHCLASLKFWLETDARDALCLCLLFPGMPNLFYQLWFRPSNCLSRSSLGDNVSYSYPSSNSQKWSSAPELQPQQRQVRHQHGRRYRLQVQIQRVKFSSWSICWFLHRYFINILA